MPKACGGTEGRYGQRSRQLGKHVAKQAIGTLHRGDGEHFARGVDIPHIGANRNNVGGDTQSGGQFVAENAAFQTCMNDLNVGLDGEEHLGGRHPAVTQESQRMRFYDEKHNLKIVLDAQSILYVEADVNYVDIYYSENDKIRSYSLRNSMKAIDELCHDHGLVRCQRSFYVNPRHIKVLRKEKDGIVYAELDAKDVRHIPVTKKYYDKLTEMLY